MSLWKFGNFEKEIDFTDADFLDALNDAKVNMAEELKKVPKVGKNSDIIRAQVQCYRTFFDTLFGAGAGEAIFEGKTSLEVCLRAASSLVAFEDNESQRIDSQYSKYYVKNHGNREQRRRYNKKHKSGKQG